MYASSQGYHSNGSYEYPGNQTQHAAYMAMYNAPTQQQQGYYTGYYPASTAAYPANHVAPHYRPNMRGMDPGGQGYKRAAAAPGGGNTTGQRPPFPGYPDPRYPFDPAQLALHSQFLRAPYVSIDSMYSRLFGDFRQCLTYVGIAWRRRQYNVSYLWVGYLWASLAIYPGKIAYIWSPPLQSYTKISLCSGHRYVWLWHNRGCCKTQKSLFIALKLSFELVLFPYLAMP